MARPQTKGFQKPIDTGQRKKVGIATIHTGEVSGRKIAACSCGKPFVQPRDKVRDKAIDKHVNEKHGGRAIWL